MINNQLTGNGKKINKVKRAINSPMIYDELVIISAQYPVILENIEHYINNYVSIEEGYNKISNLLFGDDQYNIKDYINKRISANGVEKIINDSSMNPYMKGLLLNSYSSSISVERSFSQLKNILRDDSRIHDDNISDYITMVYNQKKIN